MLDDLLDGLRQYKPCANPSCQFVVPTSTVYCCVGCDLAQQGGYEIHESGMLGHGSWCARRLPAPPSPDEVFEEQFRARQARLPSGRRDLTAAEIQRLREEQR
jgi:hypothetical protein